jgi:hypothetical protein
MAGTQPPGRSTCTRSGHRHGAGRSATCADPLPALGRREPGRLAFVGRNAVTDPGAEPGRGDLAGRLAGQVTQSQAVLPGQG